MVLGGQAFPAVSALIVPGGSAPAEATAVFARLDALLAVQSVCLLQVASTWLWLDDSFGWYAQFNRVRNAAFRRAGLIDDVGVRHLPASTGIGATPAGGGLSLGALAVSTGPAPVVIEPAGRQHSAFRYGFAFAHVMRVDMLGAGHFLVSGTATSDAEGGPLTSARPRSRSPAPAVMPSCTGCSRARLRLWIQGTGWTRQMCWKISIYRDLRGVALPSLGWGVRATRAAGRDSP
jgi:hypothetical protein